MNSRWRLKPGWITMVIGWLVYKIIGWKVDGKIPDVPKAMLIVAPHTSNWDFPIGLMCSFLLKRELSWVGKHTLFKGIFGPFFRWLGGIAVDRRSRQNIVEQVVETFKKKTDFILVIAPEGTRKMADHWKSGFYHIALSANVPVLCGYIDYSRRKCGIGPLIHLSGNVEVDLGKIREFYARIKGKFPENQAPVTFANGSRS